MSRVYLQAGMECVHACAGEEGVCAPRDGFVCLCVGWRVYFSTLGLCVHVLVLCVWLQACKGVCSGGCCTHRWCRGVLVAGTVLPLLCAQVGVGGEGVFAPTDALCVCV